MHCIILNALSLAAMQAILTEMQKRFEWDPIMEGENIIGLKKSGQSVTLEPGIGTCLRVVL